MPVGTTTAWARVVECVNVTGQRIYGGWQAFTVSDGVIAVPAVTAAATLATNAALGGYVPVIIEGVTTGLNACARVTITENDMELGKDGSYGVFGCGAAGVAA
jgi:hypothetical protein